jgi:hypothetical protein
VARRSDSDTALRPRRTFLPLLFIVLFMVLYFVRSLLKQEAAFKKEMNSTGFKKNYTPI